MNPHFVQGCLDDALFTMYTCVCGGGRVVMEGEKVVAAVVRLFRGGLLRVHQGKHRQWQRQHRGRHCPKVVDYASMEGLIG